MSAIDDWKRLEDLIIFGECDGDVPQSAPDWIARQCVTQDGQTRWAATETLLGRSLIEQVREKRAAFKTP